MDWVDWVRFVGLSSTGSEIELTRSSLFDFNSVDPWSEFDWVRFPNVRMPIPEKWLLTGSDTLAGFTGKILWSHMGGGHTAREVWSVLWLSKRGLWREWGMMGRKNSPFLPIPSVPSPPLPSVIKLKYPKRSRATGDEAGTVLCSIASHRMTIKPVVKCLDYLFLTLSGCSASPNPILWTIVCGAYCSTYTQGVWKIAAERNLQVG